MVNITVQLRLQILPHGASFLGQIITGARAGSSITSPGAWWLSLMIRDQVYGTVSWYVLRLSHATVFPSAQPPFHDEATKLHTVLRGFTPMWTLRKHFRKSWNHIIARKSNSLRHESDS